MTNKIQPYNSFPDYILGITYEIWEGRGINKIRNYYHKDTIVRSADGVVKGNENVGFPPTGYYLRQPIRVMEDMDIQVIRQFSIEQLLIVMRSNVQNMAG